jgi:hypothetical protein
MRKETIESGAGRGRKIYLCGLLSGRRRPHGQVGRFFQRKGDLFNDKNHHGFAVTMSYFED